ncbi:thioesterase II family protein [Streptomyces sp. NPDC051913]|uniref:thioesterase II family protein n=1 Tax=Streptomyces sp. NPDC051913 TaxID=3365676 RepID=UPI0037D696F8
MATGPGQRSTAETPPGTRPASRLCSAKGPQDERGSSSTKEGNSISDRIFLYGPPSPAADLRIFCLPYAGKGASLYRQWWEASDQRIEFVPVQLPGRENRFKDGLVHDMRELVASLAADIAPHTDRPYALFGHCMGAVIAFELAHRLSDLTGHRPQHLVVAGSAAPHRQQAVPAERQRTDAELMTELRRLGGTPQAALDDERLLAFALPVFRADWSAVDGYGYRPTPALDTPITVLGAADDAGVPTDELGEWERHTNADTKVHVLPGDHFFMERSGEEVRGLLVSELSGDADVNARGIQT